MSNEILNRRRQELMSLMGNGVAIVSTAHHQSRNGDVQFQFRPDSDFYYLTQFPEPEAVAVFAPGRDQGEYVLFCREKDPLKEMWEGRRSGIEGALEKYGADQAFPIERLHKMLPEFLDNRDRVYTMMGRYPEFDSEIITDIAEVRSKRRSGIQAPWEYVDLRHILHEMRLIKKKDEMKTMRAAGKLAAAGHIRAMQCTRPGRYEYQVQAEMECEFQLGGSDYPAYPSIVAGGANACILHYIDNNCRLNDGDLLLIDAGAEVDCYASDITRTFPVNGKYSAEQRAVYDVVLEAQRAAIAAVKPDNTVIEYHETAVRVLTQGLADLGLLQGEVDGLIESDAYQKFYMHRTGHWLGMDVHDVGDYKIDDKWRLLEPGMVLTVEPGLYIAPADNVDEKWHNIGIRIEDDVHVTRDGCEVLSGNVPTDAGEIEALMAS